MRSVWPKSGEQRVFKSDNGSRWTPNQQDKLLANTTSSDVLWSLTDHLGTIRDVLSDTTTHLIYDAFGNLTSGTNPLLFGYTGKPFDNATNLQNNINRWYDATTGRWLSTDPVGFQGYDTNLYRYVGNRIPRFYDPYGLFFLFGEDCVCPWDSRASWSPSTTFSLWFKMGKRATVGVASGAAGGALTGAASGAIVGSVTGPGVGPAAGAGAIAGATWGGISGFIDAAVAAPESSYYDTAERAIINGAISGVIPGGIAGMTAQTAKSPTLLYSYATKDLINPQIFESSTGRVYFTLTSPDKINSSVLTRFLSTGHINTFQKGCFKVLPGSAASQEFYPISFHISNFWKSFGGQFNTRIGTIGFTVGENMELLAPIRSPLSFKSLKALLGTTIEYTIDVSYLYELKFSQPIYREQNHNIFIEVLAELLYTPSNYNNQ